MGRSWQLTNVITGDKTMQRGRMDITLTDGAPEEVPSPDGIAAQRIEKSSVEPQGSNPFSSGWGSPFASLLGEKMIPAERGREVGAGLRTMIDAMVREQNRVARSTPLDPAETIVGLISVAVTVATDTMVPEAVVRTGVGTTTARPVIT